MSGRAAATVSTLIGIAMLGVSLLLPVGGLPPAGDAGDRTHASLSPVVGGGAVRPVADVEPAPLPAPDIEGSHTFRSLEDLGPPLPRSRSVGAPNGGRLLNGVQLPASSEAHFTFDSALRRSPSRGWRRWATELTIERTQRVLNRYRLMHPEAARLGVGDLSRPRGGAFGRKYGGLGHASHQNGLDVDLYWPRRDGRERPPRNVKQVDRKLSQDLVDLFVDAGAELVFVGPRTGLKGPKKVVHVLVNHDDHVHVRWPAR